MGDSSGSSSVAKSQDSEKRHEKNSYDATQKILPVERYLTTEAEDRTLALARNKLVEKCMRSAGYSDFMMPPHVGNPVKLITRRYGLTDLNEAQRRGYEPTDNEASENSTSEFNESLSPDARKRLVGDSGAPVEPGSRLRDPGCLGHALEVINGSKPPYEKIDAAAMKVQADSWNRSFRDGRLINYFEKWSACMRRSGYSFRTPMDAPGEGKMNKSKEIKMAVTEVKCNISSGLLDRWYAIDSDYQKTLIRKNIVALEKGRKVMDSRLRTARAELATDRRSRP
ncbi:hypothetical protein ABZ826_24920 [Streptomyces sp. NPDC047515]|uniref:hypothetical protein n=1 Tax=Streptomyces sp. NPDC047515 TaxID=3155380 RepID=UPI0033EA2657